ncbi:MAG: hypothetical protein ACTHX5_08855 [Brevibacterium aurantiacum]|nr:hypothetical protein [Brevibacterium sp.]
MAARHEGISIGNTCDSHFVVSENGLIHRVPDRPDHMYRWADIEALELYLPIGRWLRPALADILVGALRMALTLGSWTDDAPIGSLAVDAIGETPAQLDVTRHCIVGYDSGSARTATNLLREIHCGPKLRGILRDPEAVSATLRRLF